MFKFSVIFSVKEIPRHAESEYPRVDGVVGREEIVSARSVHMAHHHEEPRVFEAHVGEDVYDGVVAHLLVGVAVVLHRVLAECGTVVRCVIACEISYVAAEVHVEHFGDFKSQEQTAVNVECRHGEYVVVA